MNNPYEDPFATPDPAASQPKPPFQADSFANPLDVPRPDVLFSVDPFAEGLRTTSEHGFIPESVTSDSRKRRIRIIGAAVATAAVAAGGGLFALQGGSADTEAMPATTAVEMADDSHVTTIVPETSTTMAPVTIAPEQVAPTSTTSATTEIPTSAAPATTEALPVPAAPANPFERTGAPEQDAMLAWFEQANQNTHVEVRNEEFVQPSAETGLLGVIDANEAIKEELGAQFEFAFLHSSGLQVNVYRGGVNGLPDVELDADSIAITMDFVQEFVRQANGGFLNEQEMSFIENLDQTDALAGKGLNLVFVDRNSDNELDMCLEELRQQGAATNPATCQVVGNTSVLYGGMVSNSATIAVQLPQYKPEQQLPKEAEIAWQQSEIARVIAHEYGHALVEFSGASDRYEIPILERAKQEASPNGYLDAEIYSSLYQQYMTPVVEAEHTQYVNQAGQMLLDVSHYNTDEIYFLPATDAAGEPVVVESLGQGAYTIQEPRLPYTTPPVRINS